MYFFACIQDHWTEPFTCIQPPVDSLKLCCNSPFTCRTVGQILTSDRSQQLMLSKTGTLCLEAKMGESPHWSSSDFLTLGIQLEIESLGRYVYALNASTHVMQLQHYMLLCNRLVLRAYGQLHFII